MFDWNKSRKDCFMEFYNFWLNNWVRVESDTYRYEFNPITWGQGDLHLLRKQFYETLTDFDVDLPRRIVDVKNLVWFDKMVKGNYNSARMSLATALKEYKLAFLGDAHNSADDALNTLALFRKLLTQKRNTLAAIKHLQDSV